MQVLLALGLSLQFVPGPNRRTRERVVLYLNNEKKITDSYNCTSQCPTDSFPLRAQRKIFKIYDVAFPRTLTTDFSYWQESYFILLHSSVSSSRCCPLAPTQVGQLFQGGLSAKK